MIEIDAVLDGGGVLKACTVKGHAGMGRRGEDIVCAAVSILTRTAYTVLSGRKGIQVSVTAPSRGLFSFEVCAVELEMSFLAAVSTFLLEGLASVVAEYPEHCTISYRGGN
jgi:uncharacterized protein YsxB (DUF464 family)